MSGVSSNNPNRKLQRTGDSVRPRVQGISFVPPPGWQAREIQEGHLLECLLCPEPSVSHAGRIVVLKPDPGHSELGTAFGTGWPRWLALLRQQGLTVSDPTDAIAYYWGHLDCGLTIYWMGRFFYDPDPRKSVYAALYTLGLPGATQSIFATATPLGGSPSLAQDLATSARLTLFDSVRRLFSSVDSPTGRAVQPLFTAADVIGHWSQNVGTPGAHVWNTVFHGYAGHVGTGQGVTYRFDAAGLYECQFTVTHSPWSASMPSYSQQGHRGRWWIDGDFIRLEPASPNGRDNSVAVVGAGWRNTGSVKRRLLLLSPSPGQINHPDLVPDGRLLDVSGKAVAWCEEAGG